MEKYYIEDAFEDFSTARKIAKERKMVLTIDQLLDMLKVAAINKLNDTIVEANEILKRRL